MGAITEDDYTMEHAFNTNIATKYDVNIALLIQHFKHWTLNNLANKRNLHEGLCWTYNTVQAFCEIFHYWTRHQIEHLLKKAEAQELIVSGNHNQNKYDRTKWYALTPKVYHFYEELQTDAFMERLYSSISPDSEMHKCLNLPISENSEIEFANFRNLFRRIPKPIPDTKPDTDPNINNIGTSDEVLSVDNFFVELEDKNNQVQEELKTTEGLEGSISQAKSDYRKNQTKKESDLNKIEQYGIKNILQTNIFQIPEEVIQDWITNRKKKRAAITKTAWNKINKELTKCKEQGIDPIDAFETMVASGWQSMKVEYFLTKESITKQEAAKKRSIELEQEAADRKQKEIEDSKRIRGIVTQASEYARKNLREMIGARAPEKTHARRII